MNLPISAHLLLALCPMASNYTGRTSFHWLMQSLNRLKCQPRSVLELGCFDAKTIGFLPVLPERYVGYDADWEGGLDIAKATWENQENFEFIECCTPDEMKIEECFDISICMDTIEHVPSDLTEPYLARLSGLTKKYIFSSMAHLMSHSIFGREHWREQP